MSAKRKTELSVGDWARFVQTQRDLDELIGQIVDALGSVAVEGSPELERMLEARLDEDGNEDMRDLCIATGILDMITEEFERLDRKAARPLKVVGDRA